MHRWKTLLCGTNLSSSLQLDLLMSLQALMLLFLLGMSSDLLGLLSRISGRKLTRALEDATGEGSPLGSIS
jgi:hypothetical protein